MGDSAAFLKDAFYSAVQRQTLQPAEVVLVQDGPVGKEMTSMIAELSAASPIGVKHIVINENRGLANALAIGLEHTTHDVVARMDADDISEADRFERQLPLIAAGYELVGSGMTEFVVGADGSEVLGQLRIPPVEPSDIQKYARFHDPFNHPTVIYDRRAVARAGGYEPLGMMEDYWLFARMLMREVRATNVPLPLVRYRVSSGAYQRRGGLRLLASEWELQRAFRRARFTSLGQFLRNVALRCGYRLVPVGIRTVAYRCLILRRTHPSGDAE